MTVRLGGSEYIRGSSSGGFKEALITSRGRILVYSASQDSKKVSSLDGNAFNLNTGSLSGITTASSGLAYYYHGEDLPILIDTLIIGTSAVASAVPQPISIIKNPTTGTLISDASAGTISNRNFGSSNALTNSLFYKAAAPDAETVTNGSEFAYSEVASNARTVLTELDITLEKGSSVAVTMTPSEALDVYVAIVAHLVDL